MATGFDRVKRFFRRGNPKWRNDHLDEWNKDSVLKLMKEIKEHEKSISKRRRVSHERGVRILFLGKTGHGKSSLINTIYAALAQRYSPLAKVGSHMDQLTQHYTEYRMDISDGATKVETSDGKPFIVKFCDIRGLGSKTHGLPFEILKQAVRGELTTGQAVQSQSAMSEEETTYRRLNEDNAAEPHAPTDMMAMVFFVVDIMKVKRIEQAERDEFAQIYKFCNSTDIPVALFLTKCDTCDSTINRDLRQMHVSTKIEAEVRGASEVFGIPLTDVFPVKNYVEDPHYNPQMAVQVLYPIEILMRGIDSRLLQLD